MASCFFCNAREAARALTSESPPTSCTPQEEVDLFGTSLFGINATEIKLGGENLRFAAREPELRVSPSSIAMRGTPFGQPTLPPESGGRRMVLPSKVDKVVLGVIRLLAVFVSIAIAGRACGGLKKC